MFQALLHHAGRLLAELGGSLNHRWGLATPARPPAAGPTIYKPLKRVVLTDGVGRTLFEEYAAHRAGPRGNEETGWMLLGLREATEAVVLATLPAGAQRDAGVAHVQFNSMGQVLGSRIVRQFDRRLTILGVVHTHPGSLRHPSDGDYRGDRQWVGQLKGREGIFGIGTADGTSNGQGLVAVKPRPHVQCLGKLCLSWYALRNGDADYRPLPIELTLGPDLARPLRGLWPTIEAHAERLDRLARQQARVTFDVVPGEEEPALVVTVPLAEPGDAVRVLLEGSTVRYFVQRGDRLLTADPKQEHVDQGVYLLLAELAALA
jgi:proteasome lid subunit RPN8/RPN11